MNSYKIFKILILILGVIGFGFFLFILIKGDEHIINTGEGIDWFIYISYITIILAILMVAFFVVKDILSGNIMKTLIPVVAFIVIVGISYMLSDGVEVVANDGTIISATQSKWIGAGLYTFYIVA